jgi:hypothetical protein
MAHKFPELEHEAPLRADAGRVCFADEVAIDFPSVRPAVERMRNAFLGATVEPPVRLEVALSRAQALLGTDVRLELPIRRTCANCGGRGEVWNDLCEACEGVGHAAQRQVLEVAMPPGIRDGARVCLTVSPRQAPTTRVELHVTIR